MEIVKCFYKNLSCITYLMFAMAIHGTLIQCFVVNAPSSASACKVQCFCAERILCCAKL